MGLIPGKHIADESIDSRHFVDASIDAEHLSNSAKDEVLNSKNFLIGIKSLSSISSGTSSSLATNALAKLIVNSSTNGLISGNSTTDGIVDIGPKNITQIISSSYEAIMDANDQIYGRITTSTSAQAGTISWDGTTTVLTSDTTGLVSGQMIAATVTGPYFEITAVTPSTSITITDPNSFGIPISGSALHVLTLTLSYYKNPSSETAYTFSSASDIILFFPESTGLNQVPFQSLNEFGGFSEVIDNSIDATEVSFDPTGLTNTVSTDVDGAITDLDSAISSITTSQTVIESVASQTTSGPTTLTDTLNNDASATNYMLIVNGIGYIDEVSLGGAGNREITWDGSLFDFEIGDILHMQYNIA